VHEGEPLRARVSPCTASAAAAARADVPCLAETRIAACATNFSWASAIGAFHSRRSISTSADGATCVRPATGAAAAH
jgi:hypothetical protein